MTAYSTRSVVQKLGIKPGFRIFVAGAPATYADIVGQLPADVTMLIRPSAGLDMVHVFARQAAGLEKMVRLYRDAIAPDGMIWVSWPKKSAGQVTDLTDQVVRNIALPLGLVDIKVCAIDDMWSALKFVIPKGLRTQAGDHGKRSRWVRSILLAGSTKDIHDVALQPGGFSLCLLRHGLLDFCGRGKRFR
jgi:hypothetical protein